MAIFWREAIRLCRGLPGLIKNTAMPWSGSREHPLRSASACLARARCLHCLLLVVRARAGINCSVKCFCLRQTLCYSSDFDVQIRNCLKAGKTAEDVLEYATIKSRVDDIVADLKHEHETEAAADRPGNKHAAPIADAPAVAAADNIIEVPPPSADPVGFENLGREDQVSWRRHALHIMRQYVRLIPEPRQASQLVAQIKESSLGRLIGDPMGLVLLHYDVKLGGEPVTRPDLRVAPLRDANYSRMVRSVLEARFQGDGDAPTLQTGDIGLIIDAGRNGLLSKS